MSKKSRTKGKYKIIDFEAFTGIFEAYSGYLFVDTFKRNSEAFLLSIALLRKCCGFTFKDIENVYKLGNSKPYSEALRVHSNKLCRYSPEHDINYIAKYRLIATNCKYFAPTLSGYERIKRYRAKRRKQ